MMQLADALRLGGAPRLALVGSGGKTSALFYLGRELGQKLGHQAAGKTVLLTATTHLSSDQLSYADHHFVICSIADLDRVAEILPDGLVLLTGPQVEAKRTEGLTGEILEHLHVLADAKRLPLLIEADGSRQRPLKAPAEHEPVIPVWVENVIVVAGLSGISKTLDADWVHRPQRFSAISGLLQGQAITVKAVARVLNDPGGGQKNIPAKARWIALLNQAGAPEIQAAAYRLALELLPTYHSVIIADLPLAQNPMKVETPRLISDKFTPVIAVHEPAAGIILAAGSSVRFGKPKQILPWRGEPMVRHIAINAIRAGLAPVVVVTGNAADEVNAALADLPIVITHNPEWRAGQSSSLIAGLRALPAEMGSAMFLLADQPGTSVGLMRMLVEAHSRNLSPIIGPLIDGRRGNPVLFDRSTFHDLLNLSGDIGGRALFSSFPVKWMAWHNTNAGLDIDTPQDYESLIKLDGWK